ncbi:MAG TPA: DEAD/DEAH box helicase [Candidatus Paceibacterota bacterium]|nr:DEAD/DEAH box helicase [Candidatus Paceibacterota bacterium]
MNERTGRGTRSRGSRRFGSGDGDYQQRRGGGRGRGRTDGSRGFGMRGGRSRGRSREQGQYIDPAKFVNKAMPVEETAYVPQHRFMDFDLDERVKAAIASRGYDTPTAIQDQSIELTLEGKDVVGIADTGSGKTGAFLIPLIDKVVRGTGEHVLIMAPTRELAIQIEDELKLLGKTLSIYSACCVGGANINPQLKALSRDPHFVIGTPGRLKDLIERDALDLSAFHSVVLDEADRMLDMGFIADMRQILGLTPADRQTLFFSATLSPEIERLIGEFLRDPVRVSLKTRDTSRNVEQDVIRVPRGADKFELLDLVLQKPEVQKVIVFGRTKHGVEKLTRMLQREGYPAVSIHGNKSQGQRQRALKQFKDEVAKILVATDVAARGLDIPDVTHVINYDLPTTHDDYVHRIGRTGRGSARGTAWTFLDEA